MTQPGNIPPAPRNPTARAPLLGPAPPGYPPQANSSRRRNNKRHRSRNRQPNNSNSHNNQGSRNQTNAPRAPPQWPERQPGPMGPAQGPPTWQPNPHWRQPYWQAPVPQGPHNPWYQPWQQGPQAPQPQYSHTWPPLDPANLDLIIHQVRMALMYREGP